MRTSGAAVLLLLAALWLTGGVASASSSPGDLVRIASLPLLVLGAFGIAGRHWESGDRLAFWIAGLIALLPLSQLVPVPAFLFGASTVRGHVSQDLALAGASAPTRVSLFPSLTESAFWALIPALAVFTMASTFDATWRRRALHGVLALVLASLVFAFFQLSLPDGSPYLLYTTWGRNFGGLFINPNHQGTAFALAATLSTALALEGFERRRRGRETARGWWGYAALVGCFLAALPLTGSRATLLLGIAGTLLAACGMTLLRPRRRRPRQRGARGWAWRIGAGLVAVALFVAALGWLRTDEERYSRLAMAGAALHVGNMHAPLGAGMGTFVPVFEQGGPDALIAEKLVNHAHNEYAQWWLEAGVLSVMLLLATAYWLLRCARIVAHARSLRLKGVATAAWSGIAVMLAHSLVDYPLRTPALMATAGLLAGVLVAGVRDIRVEGGDPAEALKEARRRPAPPDEESPGD